RSLSETAMAMNATSLIIGLRIFQFVDDNLVAIGILHHGHVTDRTLDVFGGEMCVRSFQALDRSVEIFNFNRDTRPIFRWFPLIADAADSERVWTDFVFNPNTFTEFA